MPTRVDIDGFMAHHRIAMVGVSRNPKDFSRVLFRELTSRGYDVVPVNPMTNEVEGKKSFVRVQAVEPPVEAALLMTAPEQTETVVHDCAAAGVHEVWMHRGGGQGSVNPAAVAFCREHGIRVIEGLCPYMFLSNTQFIHRLHGFGLKLFGKYPA